MLDRQNIFKYGVILVIFLAIFSRLSIGLNIVFGFVLAVILIMYLMKQNEINENVQEQGMQTKIVDIKPKITTTVPPIFNEYPDITNFLFSIQEFYSFAPPNYEDLVDNINDFLALYNETKKVHKLAGINYGLAEKKKSYALTALHTFIFSIPPSVHKNFMGKLSRAHEKLDFLLSSYLYEIYDTNKRYIQTFGYNMNTKVLEDIKDDKPRPFNYYPELENNMKLSGRVIYELY